MRWGVAAAVAVAVGVLVAAIALLAASSPDDKDEPASGESPPPGYPETVGRSEDSRLDGTWRVELAREPPEQRNILPPQPLEPRRKVEEWRIESRCRGGRCVATLERGESPAPLTTERLVEGAHERYVGAENEVFDARCGSAPDTIERDAYLGTVIVELTPIEVFADDERSAAKIRGSIEVTAVPQRPKACLRDVRPYRFQSDFTGYRADQR